MLPEKIQKKRIPLVVWLRLGIGATILVVLASLAWLFVTVGVWMAMM